MDIKAFRENVQQAFAEGLGIRMVPGLLEGPNQTREWLGSCYVPRIQEVGSRVDEEQIFTTLRVFAPFRSEGVISPNLPFDPSELEEMANKIQAVSAAHQITGFGAWTSRITSIEIDPVNQGIQAVLFSYDVNAGVLG